MGGIYNCSRKTKIITLIHIKIKIIKYLLQINYIIRPKGELQSFSPHPAYTHDYNIQADI